MNACKLLINALLSASLLAACGGSDYNGPPPLSSPPPVVETNTRFASTSLVSDATVIPAAHTDANLVNAWGIAFNPTGFVWVNAAGTGKSLLYDGNGVPQTLVVSTPDDPTGIVFNASQDFKISQNGVTAASPFIFASEGGTISAWSPSVNRTATVTMYDGGSANKVYKGLASAAYNGANYLYATDFHNNAIDVFDAGFARVVLPGTLRDPDLPAGYAPFGIQAIGGRLYVTYAQRETGGDDDVKGAGLGIVSVFDSGGNFIQRLVSGGALNAPWGLALAPSGFGDFSNKLLVANFGDGKINAYDANSGEFAGTLTKADGTPLVIDGLWGIAFGNGINSQPANTLFFTAGPDGEQHGQYGRIDML
ncbi:MAG: TIGR03118 family protein [Pseudomonadota bacterium]